MKKPGLFLLNAGTIALSFLILGSTGFVLAEEVSKSDSYYSVSTVVKGKVIIDVISAYSPPIPPEGSAAVTKASQSPIYKTGDVTLSNVPAFDWSYGASATAGAMIAGYYDRMGFPDVYTGPTDAGCIPLTNVGWGASDKPGGISECPLSATKMGLDGRTTRGHVDDYFASVDGAGIGATGPDPFFGNWPEHTLGECTGDFMKTSKWFAGSSANPAFNEDINRDGAAAYILDITGNPLTAANLEGLGYDLYDTGYGLKLFFESRGYTISTMYNQYIDSVKAAGFTFNQYMGQISAGRPVMLFLSGHFIVGIGYNSVSNEILFHDVWSHDVQRMTWGGTYNTLDLTAVTVIELADEIASESSCDKFSWIMFLPAITLPATK